MAFCTNCGADVPDGLQFCTNCGNAMGGAVIRGANASAPQTRRAQAYGSHTPRQAGANRQSPAARPAYCGGSPPKYSGSSAPPPGTPFAVAGMGGFIGMLILFSIPVAGWIACIIMAFTMQNQNRRNFARAMLVFIVIQIVLAVALYFLVMWVWEVVLETFQEYVADASGALIDSGDLGGLAGLLDGLKIPNSLGP